MSRPGLGINPVATVFKSQEYESGAVGLYQVLRVAAEPEDLSTLRLGVTSGPGCCCIDNHLKI